MAATVSDSHMTLKLSYFTSARDNHPTALEATWDDLAKSLEEPRAAACTPETCKRSNCPDKHGPAWSPASYPENATRARSAVIEVSALVLDIDHLSSDEELLAAIEAVPYAKIIHASHSDKPGDRCVRMVVALSRPVTGAEWPDFWQAATAHLKVPVDQATKDASRLYFLPSRPEGATSTAYGDGTDYLFASVEGPTLNVDTILATVTPKPDATPKANPRAEALALLAATWPTQARHLASLNLAGALAHARWDAETIARFLHDLMDVVYGPGKDPDPRKRDAQAQDSVRKVEQGEPVSGWPSLIPHVGENTVAQVTRLLGIGVKPQWVESILAQAAQPQKPTQDQLRQHYKANRAKLVRQRTNVQSQIEAKVLQRVLDFDQLAEPTEDLTQALANAIRTLLKYAPPLADHTQIAQLLLHVYPVNVGQQADKPWGDTLIELVDSCANVMAEEARHDGEFDVETSGARVGKPRLSTHNLDVAFKKEAVQLRYDEFTDRETIQRNGMGWEIIEDHHLIALRIEIDEKYDFKPSKDDFWDYVTHRARKNSFHPVREYLDGLEWDRTPRLQNWLSRYGGAPDNEYTRAIGRIVLIAAVRRVRQPGCKFDEMLILEGAQGVQKSSALKALCPDPAWFSDDLPLNADTKRSMEATGGKWIVEAGELKGMSKGDLGHLKGYLSREADKARMAYGRREKVSARQFVIIGTTNDTHYLRDATGLRRFWPVLIAFFDLKALQKDRDQLWAEAAYYEALGESIRLDPQYYAIAAEEQEDRRIIDTIEVILEECLGDHEGRIRGLDLWTLMGKDPADVKQDEQTRLGDAMKRLGWTRARRRVNGKQSWYYIKGDENIPLVVSGRKVVRGQQPLPTIPLIAPTTEPKVN